MGERIRRTDLNQLMREYKGGAFGRTPLMPSSRQPRYCYCNLGRFNVEVGEIVTITGLWQDTYNDNTPVLPQDEFISAFLSNNIIFTGYSHGGFYGTDLHAVAEEPIGKNGGVGYIHLMQETELFLAKYECEEGVTARRLDLEYPLFKISKLGDYKVLAISEEDESGAAYAIVYSNPIKGPLGGVWYRTSHDDCTETDGHIHVNFEGQSDIISDIDENTRDYLSSTYIENVTLTRESGAWFARAFSNVRTGTVVTTGVPPQATYQIRVSAGSGRDPWIATASQNWFSNNEFLQEGAGVVMIRNDSGTWQIVNVTCLMETSNA